MSANHSSPLRGLVSGVALGICFLLSWKAFICVIGCCCVLVLASRFGRWARRNEQELLEAVYAGLPFGLILLAVFQLK
jgi:threonine/homoserine/homoserine lactone efflux protein